jgi:hypothetical protein
VGGYIVDMEKQATALLDDLSLPKPRRRSAAVATPAE